MPDIPSFEAAQGDSHIYEGHVDDIETRPDIEFMEDSQWFKKAMKEGKTQASGASLKDRNVKQLPKEELKHITKLAKEALRRRQPREQLSQEKQELKQQLESEEVENFEEFADLLQDKIESEEIENAGEQTEAMELEAEEALAQSLEPAPEGESEDMIALTAGPQMQPENQPLAEEQEQTDKAELRQKMHELAQEEAIAAQEGGEEAKRKAEKVPEKVPPKEKDVSPAKEEEEEAPALDSLLDEARKKRR